ncbi:MAG TPA: serine/threonine-protein kinase [Kofleriaceae bacterium]|nr:serine/threonine-protein kinase [Kofleriaceae bacterium]
MDLPLAPGTILAGKYRIARSIGAGGMGIVYAASHVDLGTQVALKVIARQHSSDEEMVERFRREARMASQARHPHIVDVLDLGCADGQWYLAMEMLDGLDLFDAIVLQRGYQPAELIAVLDPVLSALETAHGLGLVHRDLKPENIFLAHGPNREVVVKLLDFGVVKVIDEGAQSQLTRTGSVIGTPEYMAPEQATGGKVDARADLYAVGCVAYAMLCGAPPFVDKSVLRVLTAHVTTPPEPPSWVRPNLPFAALVDAFVLRALEKDPARRFATAAEMRLALSDLARAVGAPDATTRPIRLPEAGPPGFGDPRPSGPPASSDDLARTVPDWPPHARSPFTAGPPAAPKAPPLPAAGTRAPVPPAPARISTVGILLAALVGALVAALATWALISK